MTGVYSSDKYHTHIKYNEYNEPVRTESRIQMSGKYAEKYYSDKEWKVDIGYNSKKQVEYAYFGYGKHSYTYDALGRLIKTERLDNMYNTTSTVSEVSYATNPDGSASLQISQYKSGGKTYDYTYDANGNILTVSVDGELKESYTYDALGQLVRENSAAQNKTIVYSYDSGGNILSKTEYAYTEGELGESVKTIEYTYGDSGWKDLLTGYNGENITYDEIGNPLTYRGAELSWKNGRQLATYSGKGYNISYKYTDGGIRKNKTVNGQTTEYLLNGGEILQERRGNGDILTFARDESGSIIAVEYYSETTDLISYYYYIKNLQGDVIGISDREGNTVAEYRYDSWGRLLSVRDGAGNDISENAGHIANINPIRYRGYYYDSETGFYYLQSRYYDPETGRFLNADGYVSTGQGMTGYNMFAYCGNNPVNRFDPNGQGWLSNLWNKVKKVLTDFAKPYKVSPSKNSNKSSGLSINDFKNQDKSFSLYDNKRNSPKSVFHEQILSGSVSKPSMSLKKGTATLGSADITLITGGWEFEHLDLSLLDIGKAEIAAGFEDASLDIKAMATIWSPSISIMIWDVEITLSAEVGSVGANASFGSEGFDVGASWGYGFSISANW